MNTLEDLLYYFPRRYDDYSQLKPINRLEFGEEITVLGTIQSIFTRPIRGGKMQMTEAVISDGTGSLRVTWFNQPWLASRYPPGTQVVLAGKIDQYLGRLTMTNPEIGAGRTRTPAHQPHRPGLPADRRSDPEKPAPHDAPDHQVLGAARHRLPARTRAQRGQAGRPCHRADQHPLPRIAGYAGCRPLAAGL